MKNFQTFYAPPSLGSGGREGDIKIRNTLTKEKVHSGVPAEAGIHGTRNLWLKHRISGYLFPEGEIRYGEMKPIFSNPWKPRIQSTPLIALLCISIDAKEPCDSISKRVSLVSHHVRFQPLHQNCRGCILQSSIIFHSSFARASLRRGELGECFRARLSTSRACFIFPFFEYNLLNSMYEKT